MKKIVSTLLYDKQDNTYYIRTRGENRLIYLKKNKLKGARPGDTIELVLPKKSKKYAKVSKIVDTSLKTITGVFLQFSHQSFIETDQKHPYQYIKISEKSYNKYNPAPGNILSVKIVSPPVKNKYPIGIILNNYGQSGEYSAEMRLELDKYDIKSRFHKKIKNEIKTINIEQFNNELDNRVFFEDLTITIDPDDARDFDDAVSLKKINDSYRLGIHIADVTYFTDKMLNTEKEARKRGNSIYLVDRVIPMLPFKLSNELCSLVPNEKRLTFSLVINITSDGTITDLKIKPMTIRSSYRFTYKEVDDILLNKHEKKYPNQIIDMLNTMNSLSQTLRNRRIENGMLDFNFSELKIKLNSDNKIEHVVEEYTTPAHQLIEEFMILANVTIAEYITKQNIPMIYRTHEKPDIADLISLKELLKGFGHKLDVSKSIDPISIQKIIHDIRNEIYEPLISMAILRSLKKAIYSTNNPGHFGLAEEYYTHFTSPIRRFSDLTIHKILKDIINKKQITKNEIKKEKNKVTDLANHLTEREDIANKLELISKQLILMEFAKDKIGSKFSAIITGVQQFGIFVKIDVGLEGLVHRKKLPKDYYIYDETKMELTGKRTGKRYKMFMPIKVILENINWLKREVDFRIDN